MVLALGIPKTTPYESLYNLGIKIHHNKLKPCLTKDNRQGRVGWEIKWISYKRNKDQPFEFFKGVIHICELWFYKWEMNKTYYLFGAENKLERFIQYKAHIKEIMFCSRLLQKHDFFNMGLMSCKNQMGFIT